MKRSLLKKLALVTGVAVAFSSFALMSTGCSDKKDKKDKKDKDEEEIEETEETEETDAPVETTVEETDAPVETYVIETEIEDDLGWDIPAFDVNALSDDQMKEIAQEYIDKDYMIFTLAELGEDLPEGAIEGFMGMSSGSLSFDSETGESTGSMGIVEAVLFTDKAAAEAFLEDDLGTDGLEKETSADGDTYTIDEDGMVMTVFVGNNGLLLVEAEM